MIKTILNNLLRFGLSGALLWWLFSRIDMEQTHQAVQSADIFYLILALACFFVINLILIVRWVVFIRGLGIDVHFMKALRFYLVGLFGNLFLPSAIGGDIIKIVGLCHGSHEKPKVVASVLLDRLSGFAGMVVVAVLSFALGSHLIADRSVALAIMVMAAVSLVIGGVLFNEKVYSFFTGIVGWAPQFRSALMKMHYDIALLKGRKDVLFKGVGLSALSQVCLALVFFLISMALGQNVALVYFIIFVPLICVMSTVPSIGGLGVREAGAAYFLGTVGVPAGIAVTISLFTFLFMVIVGVLGGLYFLISRPPVSLKT